MRVLADMIYKDITHTNFRLLLTLKNCTERDIE